MADYDLLQDVNFGQKPKEAKETESSDVDHGSVAKAVEHGRPDALGKAGAMHLQRMAGNAAMSTFVQRKGMGGEESDASSVHDVIGKGGGTALPDGVRGQMEQSMGHDFSDVKVHTGSDAATASKSVQAQAFTVGNEIVFNEGKYNPGSAEGDRTIAHELTHVVQQRQGSVDGESRAGGVKVSSPDDKFERQAEATADAVMSGGGGGDHAGHDHAGGVQREAEDDVQTLPIQRDESEAQEDEVQELADPTAQRAESEEQEDEGVQTLRDDSIQRAESEEQEDEVQELADPTAQRAESEEDEMEGSEG